MIRPLKGLATTFGAIPLLIIPMAFYLLAVMAGPVDRLVLTLPLVSGAIAPMSAGSAVLVFAGLVLTFEWAKSSDNGRQGLIDAALSIVLFMIAWMLFAIVPAFGTSTWLVLCAMQTADAIGGGSVAIQSARRDWGAG